MRIVTRDPGRWLFLVACLLSGACSSGPRATKCTLDGECGTGELCNKHGVCQRADPADCAWSGAGEWRQATLWEAPDEILISAATAFGPNNAVGLCVHTWAPDAGESGGSRLRLGAGRLTHVQWVEVDSESGSPSPSCLAAVFSGGTAVFLAATGGEVVLISAPGSERLDAAVAGREVVTTGVELASIGEIDRHTRGAMLVGASGVERVLVSIRHGINLLYAPGAGGWQPVWRDWEPSQYFSGAPSFILPGVSGIAPAPGFAVLQPHPARPPGLLWQTGRPLSLWDAAPFATDHSGLQGYVLDARAPAAGEAELLVASPPAADGTRVVSQARRLSAGQWRHTVVLEGYRGSPRSDRAKAASHVVLPSGSTALLVEGSVEGPGDWRGPSPPVSAALHVAWQSPGGWRTAVVQDGSRGEHRYVAPAASSVGCGHPAVCFFDQWVGSEGTNKLRLLYAESPTGEAARPKVDLTSGGMR